MRADLNSLAERYNIALIYLFGSRSDEGARYLEEGAIPAGNGSDLDIAVLFRQSSSNPMDLYGSLFRAFSQIFEPFSVDLIFLHEVDTLFRFEVIRGTRVYANETEQADFFEEDIMRRAEDLLFKRKVMNEEIMEAIADGYFQFEYQPGP